MSRGRGGRGRGRGGGFGASNLPPMGLTFADIQNISREAGELYPTMEPLPTLSAPTDDERRVCDLQDGFSQRLRKSAYYLVETTKTDELPRYSDKYRSSPAAQPTLKRKDLHQPFFPPDIFEDYFNPRRRRKASKQSGNRLKLDDVAGVEDDAKEGSEKEGSDADAGEGSQNGDDYDVDEEYDNDYAENYFDNGEGDDLDDLGDGGVGGEGGGDNYD